MCFAAGFSIVLALLVSSQANAGEGEKLVRRDIERFIRARMASTEGSSGRTSIDVPPLAVFAVDRERYPEPLRTEISTRAPEPLRGRAPVAVALFSGDRLIKRSVVTPYIRRSEVIAVPVRDLRKGAILGAGDFREVQRDAARIPRDVVRDVSEIEGLRAKRSLRKDHPVRNSQLESIPLVERGDRVQIVLQAGALQINATGKAREAGALGEWIRVVNVDSKRELSGRVDAEGRVHVSF